MKLPKNGLSKEDVLKNLEEVSSKDIQWDSGKVFGYVFDPGKEIIDVSEEALLDFYHKNGLDFTVYPSLLKMENDILDFSANHLGGDENTSGSFTSGGTESIILAVKSARNYFREKKPEIKEPEIVIPVTAHAAFHKAGHYLDIKVKQIPVDDNFKAKIDELKKAITENTILIVGSAPSYAYGVIDPIEEMAAIAKEKDILFHTDGCMGGFLLKYFKKLGVDIPNFDFSVPGVTSMSMDLHKYAYTPKGASIVLYKNKELRRHQIFACANWMGYTMINNTIQSTKSGGPLAAAWTTLQYIGEEKYLEFAKLTLEATEKVESFINQHPELKLIAHSQMTLVAFTSDTVNIFHIIDEMNLKGWYIQPALAFQNAKESIHLSINLANVFHMDAFLEDLKIAIEDAKKLPNGILIEKAQQIFAETGSMELNEEVIGKLIEAAGVNENGMPERMAPINEVMNMLPPEMREELLIEFSSMMFK